ncbi:LacI family DNA-binding transcriptional regulator [Isoptericola chiayiensis]|uniref:LacI family DNA-binding transcriptional regulator n=1 Tax=Isoptericola chiayiensis TaxID=579446 RepID=A0ABP8Y7D9_9MICO
MGSKSRSGKAQPRLVDVAEQAGVSLATASRALAGRNGVSAEVAAHVRDIAATIGYVANPHARSLAGGAASVAGLLVFEIGDPYFSEIASGVIGTAAEHGWSVQISHTERRPASEAAQLRLMRASRVGAIIVAGSGYVDPAMEAAIARELDAFQESGGRAVVIGQHQVRADAVLPDNCAAAVEVAAHLIRLGHRHLAVVAGPEHLRTVADRLKGIRTALSRHGLDPDSLPVLHASFTREGGERATLEMLDARPETTAILALNDAMATGVLSALRRRGQAVPRDISVTGFDDIQVAQDLAPALTTARLPMSAMGSTAFELALLPRAQRPRRRRTDHELVVRDSTAPPR